MRRQHQRVGRQMPVMRQAVEVFFQGIGVGLGRIDADMRRDLRQDLVARDHHAQLFAVKTGMLRRVAVADDHLPAPAADLDPLAVDDAPVRPRDLPHRLPVVIVAPRPQLLDGVRLEAQPAEMVEIELRRHVGGVEIEHAAEQPFAPGRPQRRLPAFAQPTGEAHMVGVKMRADHAGHRPAGQITIQHLVPQLADLVCVHAGIDDGPAVAVVQQPEIDVTEPGQLQRHAQPEHARRDLDCLGRIGHAVEGITQLISHWARPPLVTDMETPRKRTRPRRRTEGV